jgi:hypothetical protein
MAEQPPQTRSERGDHADQPPVDDSVRCPGCATTRQWASFDDSPDVMDAIGTCPNCGTHIIGFDVITGDDRAEWAKFRRSLIDQNQDQPPRKTNG